MVSDDISPVHGILGDKENFLCKMGQDNIRPIFASISEMLKVPWGTP